MESSREGEVSRRGFLKGLMASAAIAAISPALLPVAAPAAAPPRAPGPLVAEAGEIWLSFSNNLARGRAEWEAFEWRFLGMLTSLQFHDAEGMRRLSLQGMFDFAGYAFAVDAMGRPAALVIGRTSLQVIVAEDAMVTEVHLIQLQGPQLSRAGIDLWCRGDLVSRVNGWRL